MLTITSVVYGLNFLFLVGDKGGPGVCLFCWAVCCRLLRRHELIAVPSSLSTRRPILMTR